MKIIIANNACGKERASENTFESIRNLKKRVIHIIIFVFTYFCVNVPPLRSI